MFHSRNQRLFRDNKLDAYLRQRSSALETEIRNLSLSEITAKTDEELVQQLLAKYQVTAPVLDESKLDIEAHEAMVQVRDHFSSRFDRGGVVSVPGHSITIRVPFSGPGELFKCTPSTWSPSGTPDATIESGNLVLHYETTEKDPEKIKSLWKNDLGVINQNLGWVEKDLAGYNASLVSNMQAALNKRKKEAEESKSLIDKLKG